jgi:hypothetical protein
MAIEVGGTILKPEPRETVVVCYGNICTGHT